MQGTDELIENNPYYNAYINACEMLYNANTGVDGLPDVIIESVIEHISCTTVMLVHAAAVTSSVGYPKTDDSKIRSQIGFATNDEREMFIDVVNCMEDNLHVHVSIANDGNLESFTNSGELREHPFRMNVSGPADNVCAVIGLAITFGLVTDALLGHNVDGDTKCSLLLRLISPQILNNYEYDDEDED